MIDRFDNWTEACHSDDAKRLAMSRLNVSRPSLMEKLIIVKDAAI